MPTSENLQKAKFRGLAFQASRRRPSRARSSSRIGERSRGTYRRARTLEYCCCRQVGRRRYGAQEYCPEQPQRRQDYRHWQLQKPAVDVRIGARGRPLWCHGVAGTDGSVAAIGYRLRSLPRRRPQHDVITTKLLIACSDKKDMLPTAAGPKHRPHGPCGGRRARMDLAERF